MLSLFLDLYRRNFSISAFSILFLAVFLAFTACKTSDDHGDQAGSVTFHNLPAEYSIEYVEISNNSMPQWIYYYGNVFPPDDDAWKFSVIGCSVNSEKPYYNKVPIHSLTYALDVGPDHVPGYIGSMVDFTYSGSGSAWVEINVSGRENSTFLGFNNVQFSKGHASIDFAASSFILPQTYGKFTLTGAGEFNNKYAILYGAIASPMIALYGFGDATSATALKGFKITGGTVEIPVYQIDVGAGAMYFDSYSGYHTVTGLVLIIMDQEDFDTLHYAGNPMSYSYLLYTNAAFSGGQMTKNVSEGTKIGF